MLPGSSWPTRSIRLTSPLKLYSLHRATQAGHDNAGEIKLKIISNYFSLRHCRKRAFATPRTTKGEVHCSSENTSRGALLYLTGFTAGLTLIWRTHHVLMSWLE